MNLEPEQTDTPVHRLISPEGVRLDLAVAGPAPRMFAYAIDLIFIALIVILLFVLLLSGLRITGALEKLLNHLFREAMPKTRGGQPNPPALSAAAGLLIAIVTLLQAAVENGYFIFWEMATNGRSPGKATIGLRVVRRNGYPIDFTSSVIRNVLRAVDILPASYGVGLISMLISASGERLGDHAAGTIVIRLDRPQIAPEIEVAPESPALSLTREQVARIGPRELQLIRNTLRRASSLESDGRAALQRTEAKRQRIDWHRVNADLDRRDALLAEVAEIIGARLEIAQTPADPQAFLGDLLALAERYSRTHRG